MSSAQANEAALREKLQAALDQVGRAAQSFADRARTAVGTDPAELLDPKGDAIRGLVDAEKASGASLLAAPLELLLFETWVLGHLGDHEDWDMDIAEHKELWFRFGAWIGEQLLKRHGGFWMVSGEDPRTWRIGFQKIMVEVAPHMFADRLIHMGNGFARQLVAEIERIRLQHEAARQAGKEGSFQPQHYARLHSVPLGQFLVLDMNTLTALWGRQPTSTLVSALKDLREKVPPQNQQFIDRVQQALAQLKQEEPPGPQIGDRRLYEAIAQMAVVRYASPAIPMDVMEKIILPAAHIGAVTEFPPLGDDDKETVKKGTDLFAVYVDVVPYQHRAVEDGFLGAFPMEELGTPYMDRQNLDLGHGDWVALKPDRLREILGSFEPRKLVAAYDAFAEYVRKQEGLGRVPEPNRGLVEMAAQTLGSLKAGLGVLKEGHALVFRLLPPP